MAEKSSLEGWTKAVDNALQEWHDEENIDASGTSKKRISSRDSKYHNCFVFYLSSFYILNSLLHWYTLVSLHFMYTKRFFFLIKIIIYIRNVSEQLSKLS